MKYLSLFFILLFLGFHPLEINAQKKLSEPERLAFEAAFFEALQQKAIENYDKAILALEICQAIDSTNISVQFEFSKNFFWLKNYFEAKQIINKALKKEPQNIWLLAHAKNIAVAQGNYSEALAYQLKIAAINPTKKIGLLNLYLALNKKQKARDLIATLEKEQGLNSRLKKLKRALVEPLVKKKKNVKKEVGLSLEELKSTYNSNKDFKILRSILEIELEQTNYKNLLDDAIDGLELFPSQTSLYLFAARASNALKMYKKALEHLDNGIDFVIDKPTQKKYYLAYSVSYNGLNNKQKASYYKKLAAQL
ncbi:MAG: hypothetical protein L3J45_07835 [Flavobacteriaceae bacterium]|nr:hypothetical protein [Flavobacteriaceae bacterium]